VTAFIVELFAVFLMSLTAPEITCRRTVYRNRDGKLCSLRSDIVVVMLRRKI